MAELEPVDGDEGGAGREAVPLRLLEVAALARRQPARRGRKKKKVSQIAIAFGKAPRVVLGGARFEPSGAACRASGALTSREPASASKCVSIEAPSAAGSLREERVVSRSALSASAVALTSTF